MTAFQTRVRNVRQETQRRMILVSEDSERTIAVPYAPRSVKLDGLSREYAEIERAGRTPILSDAGVPLQRLGFDLFFGSPDPDASVEHELAALRQLAASEDRITVAYGPSEGGSWRITQMSQESLQRHQVTDEVVRAVVTIELTQVSDAAAYTGPLSGGYSGGNGGKKGEWVTLKQAQTLHQLAVKHYKDPKKWRLIADANKIRNPKASTKLAAGKKVYIPPLKKK